MGLFGILVISDKSIYFLEERPGFWVENKQSAVRDCIEMLSLGQAKQNSKRNGQSSSRGKSGRNLDNFIEDSMQEI